MVQPRASRKGKVKRYTGRVQPLLTIGEVAKRTKVPVKTIRYYDEVGILTPDEVSEAGYRLYGDAQVGRLGLIRTLRETGFSIKDVRQLLAGETSPDEAIALQLEVIQKQVEKLTLAQAVLERAQQEDDALSHLHTLGTTLKLTPSERRAFLRTKMRDVMARKAPPEWRERFMTDFFANLPDTFGTEQVEAWVELVEILEDERVRADYEMQMATFWRTVEAHHIDPQVWQEGLNRSLETALAALEAGEGPNDVLVQTGVEQWVDHYAAALGREPDSAFYRWFGEVAPTFVSETGWRLQELVFILWQRDITPVEAQRLLLRGLEYRLAL